jgi:acetoacetate decarboxylase
MRKEDVLKLPSMPAAGPSYPAGPYRFINREFLVITYETDPELIREQLPEPLEPLDRPLVNYEWIKMPDSSGFGSYTESGIVIPARLRGEEVNFVSQMYLDDDPPIAAGREIQEIRPSQARDREGHAHRHALLCRPARRHGHHGL